MLNLRSMDWARWATPIAVTLGSIAICATVVLSRPVSESQYVDNSSLEATARNTSEIADRLEDVEGAIGDVRTEIAAVKCESAKMNDRLRGGIGFAVC